MKPALNDVRQTASFQQSSVTSFRLPAKYLARPHRILTTLTPQNKSRQPVRSQIRHASADSKARALNQKSFDSQLSGYDAKVSEQQEKQIKAPWHREGSDAPPVRRQRSASAMTKGKLLSTPSRLLKLVLPLSTVDINSDRKDVAPLALLVHPNQPLSYLTRLIQSEVPKIRSDKGEAVVPDVSFRAMESRDDERIQPQKHAPDSSKGPSDPEDPDIGEGGVQSYSGAGRESTSDSEGKYIRWSASTEIGDFIRDAARAKEFEVEIEGKPDTIKVGVPSFNDRTFYLRQSLRRLASRISEMVSLKSECDEAARLTGRRYAMAGCGGLVGYWVLVYRLTFETDLGWDFVEPVTYLVGLSTLIGGYLWFLYNNREVSYRSALNLTISRRQSRLYEQRGFDLQKWESLIEEANALRKEIKAVAKEYDCEWDEQTDEKDPKVVKALREDRKNSRESKKSDDDENGD